MKYITLYILFFLACTPSFSFPSRNLIIEESNALFKTIQVSGKSYESAEKAMNNASYNIPEGYVIIKIHQKKIGGIYYCWITLKKL